MAPKNVEIINVRVALQTLLNQTRRLGNPRRISVWPVASHVHCPVSQSAALTHLEDPRQRLRVDARIHSDTSSVSVPSLRRIAVI